MQNATFARWSTQKSFVHALDPRAKLILLLCFLISVALLAAPSAVQLGSLLAALMLIAAAAGLPVLRLLRASLLVVPFVGLFALLVYLTGNGARAWFILAKSYLSLLGVILLVSSTPLSKIVAAARFFRAPALLVEVTQLIYRYLFVLAGEARSMQIAFRARVGRAGRTGIRAASGMVAVLFVRSYERAALVHHAMRSRGFSGALSPATLDGATAKDLALTAAALIFLVGVHFV